LLRAAAAGKRAAASDERAVLLFSAGDIDHNHAVMPLELLPEPGRDRAGRRRRPPAGAGHQAAEPLLPVGAKSSRIRRAWGLLSPAPSGADLPAVKATTAGITVPARIARLSPIAACSI
jgi:hypothetical protein